MTWECRTLSAGGVADCLASFDEFARGAGMSAGMRHDLAVILDELLTNAARHALHPAGGEGGELTVAVARRDGAWEVAMRDRGPAFDPLAAPEPAVAAPLAERVPGGVGIHLVRRLAAGVSYERLDGENRLRVRMRPEEEDRP